MDFHVLKEAVSIYREVFSGSSEQPIDLDVTLPDYCPDISRILKCQIVPQITSRQVIGDRLNVEGSSLIRLLYADEESSGVRSCELTSAFSADFNLKMTPECPSIFTPVRVDFVNCRAVTKRRIDIHGAFTVFAKVLDRQQEEVLSGAQGAGVLMRQKNITVDSHIGAAQQPFTVNETFELSPGKPEAQALVRFSASGTVTEYKAIANKLIAKGEIKTTFLYLTDIESGTLDTMEYTIPFSQILDIDGADEDCTFDVRTEILSMQAQLNEASANEDVAFEVEIRAALFASASRAAEIPVVTDAYSTDFDLATQAKPATFEQTVDQIGENFICKGVIPAATERISSVIDAWCDVATTNAVQREGGLEFSGRVNVCLLVQDDEGTPFYHEAMIDYSNVHEYPGIEGELSASPDITALSVGYRISGNEGIEVRVEMRVSSPVHARVREPVLVQMELDETHPKSKEDACALIIYYAEEGEALWDIARRYNTSIDAVRRENDLEQEESAPGGMMLIPAI